MSDPNSARRRGNGDALVMPFATRLSRDLTARAAAAGLPRHYMPAPDLRAAVLAWIDQHAQVLDDDQKTAWKRHADLLTDAVLEIPLAPGRLDAQLVCVDAPLRLLLREIDGLAKLGVLHLDALDDSEVDDDVVPAGNVTTTDDDTDDDSTP